MYILKANPIPKCLLLPLSLLHVILHYIIISLCNVFALYLFFTNVKIEKRARSP